MKINTALILCAGYGKRLNPITLDVPKPLLKIDNVSVLEKCINLIKKLGIENILLKEALLFCNWYTPKALNKKNLLSTNLNLKKQFKLLINSLKFKNDTFVHRDFHVSNIVYDKNEFGLIDTQDALIGNIAYDLASLVDDVRFKTSLDQKNKMINYYLKLNPKLDVEKFKNDFAILSVLRNLKIIGIFTRLSVRDKKNNYLKLIPYAWQLINLRINQNKIFQKLKEILKFNFPKQIK